MISRIRSRFGVVPAAALLASLALMFPALAPAAKRSTKPVSVSEDPALAALLAGLGESRYGQRAAQAAAWHLTNDMSWQELAAERIEHLIGLHEPYFNAKELKEAREIVEEVSAKQPSEDPAGESPSRRTN